ncbi:---NA---, partial [Paramuricea clavata]
DFEETEPADMGYVCSLCSCAFDNLIKLQNHMETHRNVQTDKCVLYKCVLTMDIGNEESSRLPKCNESGSVYGQEWA